MDDLVAYQVRMCDGKQAERARRAVRRCVGMLNADNFVAFVKIGELACRMLLTRGQALLSAMSTARAGDRWMCEWTWKVRPTIEHWRAVVVGPYRIETRDVHGMGFRKRYLVGRQINLETKGGHQDG